MGLFRVTFRRKGQNQNVYVLVKATDDSVYVVVKSHYSAWLYLPSVAA